MRVNWTAAASSSLISMQLFGIGGTEKSYEQGTLLNIKYDRDCSTDFVKGTSERTCYYYVYYYIRLRDKTYIGTCRERLLAPCYSDYVIHTPIDLRLQGKKMFLKRPDGKEVHTTIERVEQETHPAASKHLGGKVTVKSVPDSADILVDGAYVGNSPATLELSPGVHKVVIKSPGFKEWVKEITVSDGSELTLSAILESD